MNKTVKWLYGSSRQFLGPQPGALVPLNLLGALFVHGHSEASMRILHGYTSIGIGFGILSTIWLLKNFSFIVSRFFFLVIFVINIWAFYLNSWIALNGMGIPYGRLFHIFLAILISINFAIFQKYSKIK